MRGKRRTAIAATLTLLVASIVPTATVGADEATPQAAGSTAPTTAPALPANCTQAATSGQRYVLCHFNATGGDQYFTVPEGVRQIDIELAGGQGGSGQPVGSNDSHGGWGGGVTGRVPVSQGDVFVLTVGNQGGKGTSGGGWPDGGPGGDGHTWRTQGCGGGGSTRIYPKDGSFLMIAAGGGGCGGATDSDYGVEGGDGGSPGVGGRDAAWQSDTTACHAKGTPGGGATIGNGGGAGYVGEYYKAIPASCPRGGSGTAPSSGNFLQGGTGGSAQGDGGGGGGGGGGGYYGGGGGGGGNTGVGGTGGGGAGGGGVNWVSPDVQSPLTFTGSNSGAGWANITYWISDTTAQLNAAPAAGAPEIAAGRPVALSALVQSSSTNVPSGTATVDVTAGGTTEQACTIDLTSSEGSPAHAAGSCTYIVRHAGTNVFTLHYGGNSGTAPAEAGRSVYPVKMVTSTAVTVNADGTRLTATVSGDSPLVDMGVVDGAGGTATFTANGVPLSLCTDLAVTDNHDATATVTCDITPTAGSDVDYAAVYGGNVDVQGSTSAPLHVNVPRSATTTGIALAATTLTYGQSATATVTVATAGAAATFDGTVDVVDTRDGGTPTTVCRAVPVDANGQAGCTWQPSGGSHQISAMFGGGTQVLPSTSTSSASLHVTAATPAVTLDANPPNGSISGQPVTLTVTQKVGTSPVAGATATFLDGGTPIPGCGAEVIAAGTATCTLVPTFGDHTFTVTTTATDDVLAATARLSGVSDVYSVGLIPSTTALTRTAPDPAASTVPAGAPVTVTAAVSAVGATPSGTVRFNDNGHDITGCTARAITGGEATCTWVPTAGTDHLVNASYAGDDAVSASATATGASFTVDRFATSSTIAVDPGGATDYGTWTTLRATVDSAGPTPTGSVTFTDAGVDIASCGTAPVTAATCRFQAGPGTHTYRAVYGGDTANAPSTSPTAGASTNTLATTLAATATRVGADEVVLTATVTSANGAAVAPTGTVTFGDGATSCTGALAAATGGSSTASCTVTVDATAEVTLPVIFTPERADAFGPSSGSVTYTPAPSCPDGLAAFVGKLGTSPLTVAVGSLGSVTVRLGGPTGPCDASTALSATVDATLFGGTLTATGVTATVTADGFCLTDGTFTVPSVWHVPTVTISTPICFTIGDAGTIDGITSGGLTATTAADAFPFVAFPNAPPASLAIGFTTDAGVTNLAARFTAGDADNPIVALSLTVASNGAFTGTLTSPGLTVLGQSLADLHVTVSGGNGTPLRFDGGVTLGPIEPAPGLTIPSVTVTVSDAGFSIEGSARVGVAGHTLTLDVAGTVHSGGDWSLSLTSAGGPLWEPVAGLGIQPDFSGTITSTAGSVTWTVTAGGSTLANWNPAPGANVTVSSVTVSNTLGECAAVPDGAHDLALAFAGSLTLDAVRFDVDGCVDLTRGAFHLETTGGSSEVTSGMSLTDAHLVVDAAISGAFHVVGGATATVTAGGTDHTLAVSFDFSSDGTLVIGGTVDLTPWGAPVTGYVAYATAAVTGFDTGDPDVGVGGRVDLAAGLTAAAVWTPSAATADLLTRAGFTLGAGGTVDLAATLAPTRSVTFHAALAAPDGMPFLTLPGGATLDGASLDFADGTLTLVADATVPMPGGAPAAIAHLAVTIGEGTFDGSATLTGLVLFGTTLNLSGSIDGTRQSGTWTIDASITAQLPGPLTVPGSSVVTISDVTLTLGTAGIAVAGTVDLAGRGGMRIDGTFTSVTDWSLSVTSTPATWAPAPGFTLTAALTGTISRTDAGVVFEVTASNPTGDLLRFTPVDGFTVAVHRVRLGNTTPPDGCRVSAAGDVWLFVDGSATLQVASVSGSASASGCFDLTSGALTLTADASAMRVSLLGGAVVVSGPVVTVSRDTSGYAVDASVAFEVHFPSGPVFTQTATLSLRSGGVFVIGVRANLSNWLGSAGASAYLYYSSAAIHGYDTGDDTIGKVDLVAGITFAVRITLPSSVTDELAKIHLTSPGGASLAAVGSLDFSNSVYTLEIRFDAGVGGQKLFTTGSGVSLALDSGYLKLTVTKGTVSFGLGLRATLRVPAADHSGPDDEVGLVGELTISTKQLAVSLQLGECGSGPGWSNAFGVDGLTVQCAALQGGLSLEGPPLPSFGMMGTITALPNDVADAIGYVNGAPMSFAFNLLPFLLSISIGTADSPDVALRPLTMVGAPDAMEVHYASLYISPTGAKIGDQSYPAGIGVAFQASIAGVSVNMLAKVDLTVPSVEFDAGFSQITVAPVTIGPVAVHFKIAAPTTFEFTFDGAMSLGPGEVDLGAIRIGGSLAAQVHLGVSTSQISAWFTASVSAYVAAYVPHETCYYKGALPYPCDWWWDRTGFDFTLGRTGFVLDSEGLTVTFDGYSLTLPFDGGAATST